MNAQKFHNCTQIKSIKLTLVSHIFPDEYSLITVNSNKITKSIIVLAKGERERDKLVDRINLLPSIFSLQSIRHSHATIHVY